MTTTQIIILVIFSLLAIHHSSVGKINLTMKCILWSLSILGWSYVFLTSKEETKPIIQTNIQDKRIDVGADSLYYIWRDSTNIRIAFKTWYKKYQ